jgi:hypothetical protein
LHADELRREAINMGEHGWMSIEPVPWHFVVLEDLGVEITE